MEKIAVIYWSGTGNTEAMANGVAEGAKAAGGEAELFSVEGITPEAAAGYDRLALGCPAMGDEVLEEELFEPFFAALEPKLQGKPVAIFGSYGWGDGQWIRDWADRLTKAGAVQTGEALMINETPDEDGLAQCRALGKALAES